MWRADLSEVDDLAPGWFAWREGGGTLAADVARTAGPGRRGERGFPLKSFEFRTSRACLGE